jgi:hypothetical protein
MVKIRRAILGISAAAAIALLPMAPALADGHGFRPHGVGLGRGIVGAAVALATLPLTVAAAVLTAGESAAPDPTPGYGGPAYGYAPRVSYAPAPVYYAPYPGYYAAPRAYYGPRPYYAGHPGYYGHGYYRGGGNSYPRR